MQCWKGRKPSDIQWRKDPEDPQIRLAFVEGKQVGFAGYSRGVCIALLDNPGEPNMDFPDLRSAKKALEEWWATGEGEYETVTQEVTRIRTLTE